MTSKSSQNNTENLVDIVMHYIVQRNWSEVLGLKHLIRAYLHGGGGPQVGEVTRLGGVTRLAI